MALVIMRALWTPKEGSTEQEWEDGFAYDESSGRAAIADGASSAVDASTWARQLVTGFTDSPFQVWDDESFAGWLGMRQAEWVPPAAGADSEWWSDAVATKGSWATLAVLDIRAEGSGWIAWLGGVGDTCWFHVRNGELLRVFPELGADDFDSHPELVGTTKESSPRTVGAYQSIQTSAADGDVFLGLTDTLAEWALKHQQAHPEMWDVLASVDQTSLAALANVERAAGRMVNDDVTLLRCQVGAL